MGQKHDGSGLWPSLAIEHFVAVEISSPMMNMVARSSTLRTSFICTSDQGRRAAQLAVCADPTALLWACQVLELHSNDLRRERPIAGCDPV